MRPDVADPSQFDSVLSKHAGKSQLYVLVSGATDPATGVSWCPDCVVGML